MSPYYPMWRLKLRSQSLSLFVTYLDATSRMEFSFYLEPVLAHLKPSGGGICGKLEHWVQYIPEEDLLHFIKGQKLMPGVLKMSTGVPCTSHMVWAILQDPGYPRKQNPCPISCALGSVSDGPDRLKLCLSLLGVCFASKKLPLMSGMVPLHGVQIGEEGSFLLLALPPSTQFLLL